jgi:hypothetical protein
MPVRCANCGEELLGAVNRCWRCGTRVASHHGEPDLPPVRALPIAGTATAAGETPAAEGPTAPESEAPESGGNVGTAGSTNHEPPVPSLVPKLRVRAGRALLLDSPSAAGAAAIAALVLGMFAFASSFFTSGALLLAIVGLPFGIFGLFSARRGSAVVGMLLCCIALAIGGFQALVWWYQLRSGMSPWDLPNGY